MGPKGDVMLNKKTLSGAQHNLSFVDANSELT